MTPDMGSTDTVMDFEDNLDRISLRVFGIPDAAAALAGATESGGNVMLDLGNAQMLTISGTRIAALADDLIL